MIVDTEKVLREADGSVKLVVVRPRTDGKVFAPGCASKPDGESREEPEEHKRLELYDLETHQKKLGPDYHRLKAMVKRSIEQEIRNKNFGARSGNFEKNAVVKNQGTKQRVQRILGDCWQWEANGQCVKGDNCSFRRRYG